MPHATCYMLRILWGLGESSGHLVEPGVLFIGFISGYASAFTLGPSGIDQRTLEGGGGGGGGGRWRRAEEVEEGRGGEGSRR